jgi:phage baseplate assembly protein W
MKFLGAPYPIKKNPRGLLATQSGLDQIKSDMLVLLMTNPGERCMLPDFGTPLRQLLFDPNDEIIAEKAREMIINSIKTWEPRITVEQIEVSTIIDENTLNPEDLREDIQHILFIRILFFDPEQIQEVQELKLKVPLGNLRDTNEQLSF